MKFKYRVFNITRGYYSLFDATDSWEDALDFASVLSRNVGDSNVVILSTLGKEVSEEYMDEKTFFDRLDSFKNLDSSYLGDEGGDGYDDLEIDNLKKKFVELKHNDLPFPFPIPNGEGGIVLVWDFGDNSAEIELLGLKYDSSIYGLFMNVRDIDGDGEEFVADFKDLGLVLEKVLDYAKKHTEN